MDGIRLTLFGPPQVTRGGDLLRFDTRKAVALLAYLAVTGRPHRRDTLAALLWPTSDQTKARSALRRTLSVAGAVGPALVSAREEVTLDLARIDCDVTEFERLVQQTDVAQRRAAAALAGADFLAGFSLRDSPTFDDWQTSTGDRLRDQLVSTLSSLVEHEIAVGRLDAATALVRRWLAADPMSESAHARLMSLLAWKGQRPAALRQYRSLVRILDSELGVAPLPETTELYDAIRSDRLASPLSGSEVPVATETDLRVEALAPSPPTVIVGREPERERLLTAWLTAAEGGRLVGLAGEPGMGRTSLAEDLTRQVARRGGRVLVVRAHEGERGLAAATARDLVRGLARLLPDGHPLAESVVEELSRLDPALGDGVAESSPMDSPGAQMRLFEAVRQLLEASLSGRPPGVLVVDDAHWLDPTSADLLSYALRRMPQGLLVVATWRPGLGSGELAGLVLEEGEVVVLGALSAEDVAELVTQQGLVGVDAVDVHGRTGGVARLVVEHLAAAQAGDAAARPLRDLVLTRLEAASAAARQLLGAAAVIGTVADPDLLRATAGRDEMETVEALEEVVGRGLLVEVAQRGGYDFPYELLRDVVRERTSLARQRLLHGRASETLVRRHAVDPVAWPAATVAHHLQAAGRRQEAAEWFWTAAQEARALYAHREELTHLRAAQAAGFEPTLVHEAAGDALTRLGRYREALVSYEQAAATSEEDVATAVVEHKLADVHDRLGEWVIALAHLESADALLSATGPAELRARVGADLALVLHRQGRGGDAERQARDALDRAEACGDARALAQVHDVLGVLAMSRGDLEAATGHLEQSAAWADRLDDVGPAVAAANNQARAYELAGRPDEALAAARRALTLGERHGDRHRVAALHTNLADLLHRRGEEDEARAQARAAAEAFADVDDAALRPQVWTLVEW